jgi:hypothetical protein
MAVTRDDPRVMEALGGLCFSCVETNNPLAVVRAAQWYNLAAPLQAGLPFFLVHDVGLALSYGTTRQVSLRPKPRMLDALTQRRVLQRTPADEGALQAYGRLLTVLARSTLAERMGTGGLSDNVMGALIAKVLEPVRDSASSSRRAVELPLSPMFYEDMEPLDMLAPDAARQLMDLVKRIGERTTQVQVAAEQVDLDTLKLMQMMGGAESAGDGSAVLDFYRVLESPQAHDIVDFCLDLVPQVLETPRSRGAQTFAMGGYASIETKGSMDSLLPGELAYDDALFEQRWSENELLYFGREKDTRERQKLHYLLVDASAAMRGLRTTFSRGLALALAKKLTLRGEHVWLRFFDSRLHERMELTARSLKVPQILCFRSERARNGPRVFEELEADVGRLIREEGKDVLITFITHGRLAIPEPALERLKSKAHVFGVFVLPSQELDLPYVRHLTRSHVVNAEALQDPTARAAAAMNVLQDN